MGCIFEIIDEGGEGNKEAEFAEHQQRMTDTKNGILDLISLVQIMEQGHDKKEVLDELAKHPSLSGRRVKQTLTKVETTLAELHEQGRLLKGRDDVT